MPTVTYEIVPHDDGWAYKLVDVFSETFPTRAEAHAAAELAAGEQIAPGEDEAISYQDKDGHWHDELVRGGDRPNVEVTD